MPGLNRVQLIGYLGKDPEMRYTPSGTKVCTFRVAVTRRWRDKDNTQREATDWINIEAWGRLGEICQEYLNKGRLVYLEGRLQIDRVEQDGEVRYYAKVVASQMQMLDRKPEEAEPVEELVESAEA